MAKEEIKGSGYICSVKKRELSEFVTVLGPHVCYIEYLGGAWRPRGVRQRHLVGVKKSEKSKKSEKCAKGGPS